MVVSTVLERNPEINYSSILKLDEARNRLAVFLVFIVCVAALAGVDAPVHPGPDEGGREGWGERREQHYRTRQCKDTH